MQVVAGQCVVILAFVASNICINMLNKIVISRTGFAFPICISTAHMLFTFLALLPIMLTSNHRKQHASALRTNLLGLLLVAACFATNVALNNLSLARISLSLNQMIRSAMPIVTASCSMVFDGVVPSKREFLSLFAMTVGISTILAEDAFADALGVIVCAISTLANGLMGSMSGRLLHGKLDIWKLSFYQAPVVACFLLPVYVWSEHARVVEFMKINSQADRTIGIVLLTCVLALLYNALHSLAIKITSATATAVIGQAKIVLLLCLSAALLKEYDFLDIKTAAGAVVAVAGFVSYGIERTRSSNVDQ